MKHILMKIYKHYIRTKVAIYVHDAWGSREVKLRIIQYSMQNLENPYSEINISNINTP